MATFNLTKTLPATPTGISATGTSEGVNIAYTPILGFNTQIEVRSNTTNNFGTSTVLTSSAETGLVDIGGVPIGNRYIWLIRISSAGARSVETSSYLLTVTGASATIADGSITSAKLANSAVSATKLAADVPVLNGGGYSHRQVNTGGTADWSGSFSFFGGQGGSTSGTATMGSTSITAWDTWVPVVSQNVSAAANVHINVEMTGNADWGFPTAHTGLLEVISRVVLIKNSDSSVQSFYEFPMFSATPTFTRVAQPNFNFKINNSNNTLGFRLVGGTGNHSLRWEIKRTRAVGTDAFTLDAKSHNMIWSFTP